MLKAVVGGDANPLVFLGLSGENLTRLIAGEPIRMNMAELGLTPAEVVILYGKTERDIAALLEHHHYLPPGFTADMPEPGSERGRA